MTADEPAFQAVRRDGVLRVSRSETEWLSSGWNGGRWQSEAAYNISVPEEWGHQDLGAYVSSRLERAGFQDVAFPERDGRSNSHAQQPGPALLTGVDMTDARGAHCGPVTAYATAGISNPAALPMDPAGGSLPPTDAQTSETDETETTIGTVNVIVGTTRALESGALANLLAVAVEAKTATLLAETGFPGTTSDAVIVGHDPAGTPAAFTGSATRVGAATRACVREAVRSSLHAHYEDGTYTLPDSVADATYGVSTAVEATVFEPTVGEFPADDSVASQDATTVPDSQD
ncbi:adenosylcobinamide amidohydrolase [Natrialba magadii ATCC 43099]|uniref:Adenosylcobinamide amidohydrolase n=1 Tax=Natrialba magadii (strain ATCC 43099 / DSM 3394 / CCM 3739 / CIP 104546 / IAM 13178 / JCM 8861 / NBRC 102185 / NCIMB 2190 / MS3) TaxID=547559 RepID=D3SQT8_NATMM|nr:adenosylcobinamide amidohydrolase [Natrialba magadii]ADD04576.1 adenosylcobinamide amidohydrolase [Natrialba magadii ATCC 43099]ELY25233.1 adenosylcobinamide amidohydrolase [Natrialba magadii ATCC 43099]